MKKLSLLICGLLAVGTILAGTIGGKVTDTEGQPLAYVTISVLTSDSTLVTGAISEESGTYSVSLPDEREYIVMASYVGYRTAYQTARAGEQADFRLTEESEQLKEVEVKAKNQLIERQMDKLVLNVSNSPLAAGSNGKDILRKAPGVIVDKDGNVTVNGKSVEVYVDGRPSYLSGQQLKAMLEGTDGNTIEKIEIMTNPSAKYDASGSGGIINIKTKKNMMQGLNGSIYTSYGGMYFRKWKQYCSTMFGSLNLSYRTKHTYTNVSLAQVYNNMMVDADIISRTPEQERQSKLQYDIRFQFYKLQLAQDFMIDDKNTVGFIFQAPVMVSDQRCQPTGYNGSVVNAAGDTTERSISRTTMHTLIPQHTANLNYTHIFNDSLERELTANIDYNRYSTRSRNTQDNLTSFADSSLWNGLDIGTRQTANIYSAKLDFQTKFWKTGMIETGVKYALSNTANDMQTDSLLDGASISVTPSVFNYNEHVAAAYITVGKQFGEHFSLKLGLRGEYTFSRGDWVSADSVSRKSYFDVFPTVFAGYTSRPLGKAAQTINTSVSYTRRITRPNYWQLNPFKTYDDAHNYGMGNTSLMPEYGNNVELNFGYSQYLSLSAHFSHTQDMQQSKQEVLPNGDRRHQWINFGTFTTHGVNLSLTELPIVPKFDDQHKLNGAWLALTLNAGYSHFLSKAYKEYGDYESHSNYYSMSGTLNAYLPKDWVISADCWYSAPVTIGYTRTLAAYNSNIGVRKSFPKIGLVLNMQLQDIARTYNYNQESRGLAEGYSSYFGQTASQQRLMLSVSYTFGTQEWYKQRKVGNMEESSRLGGGSR